MCGPTMRQLLPWRANSSRSGRLSRTLSCSYRRMPLRENRCYGKGNSRLPGRAWNTPCPYITRSDGVIYSRANLTRVHEHALAIAQRAHKKKRVKAIQAKIANTRADWTHKATTAIACRATRIVIGDVSSTKLIKTPFAKSTYDAAWHSVRFQLTYKAIRLAGVCVSGRETFSSVTCSVCLHRTGPRGLRALGVREWVCSQCGS